MSEMYWLLLSFELKTLEAKIMWKRGALCVLDTWCSPCSWTIGHCNHGREHTFCPQICSGKHKTWSFLLVPTILQHLGEVSEGSTSRGGVAELLAFCRIWKYAEFWSLLAMFATYKVYDRSKKVRFASTTLLRFCGHLSSTTGEQSLSISTICVHQLVNLPSKQCPLSIAKATLSWAVGNGYTHSKVRQATAMYMRKTTGENASATIVVGLGSS